MTRRILRTLANLAFLSGLAILSWAAIWLAVSLFPWNLGLLAVLVLVGSSWQLVAGE